MRFALAAAFLLTLSGCPRESRHGKDHATVHAITHTGAPAEGAFVLLHDETGRFVAMGELPTGDGTVTVEPGDMVTAFYAFTTDLGLELVNVQTVTGVQPDDELWMQVQSFDIAAEDRGDVTVTLSGTSAAGADGYGYALAGCAGANHSSSSPSGTGLITVPGTCTGDSFEPWAVARSEGLPIAFELLPEASLTDLLANGMTFTGPWRTDFDSIGYSLTNVPANAYSFVVNHRLYDDGGRRLASDGAAAPLNGVTSTSGAMISVPFATTSFASVETLLNSTAGTITRTRAAPIGDIAVDFATLPGFLTSATAALADSSLAIAWTGAPTSGMDTLELSSTYGVAEDRIVVWTVRASAATPSPFRYPEWPEEIAGDAPPDDPALVDVGYVRFLDGEWADWDEARTNDPRDDVGAADRRAVERNLD